jgi:hypothetical protein
MIVTWLLNFWGEGYADVIIYTILSRIWGCVAIDGYGLYTGYIDHLYTLLGTTCTYSAIANLHNSQITITPAKPFFHPVVS